MKSRGYWMMENSSFEPRSLQKSIQELDKKLLLFQKEAYSLKHEKVQKKGLFATLMRWIVK